jgi:hypothetical protein
MFWEDVVRAGVSWNDIKGLDPAVFLIRCHTSDGGCVTFDRLCADLAHMHADDFLEAWGSTLKPWGVRLLRLTWQRLQACGLNFHSIHRLKFEYVVWLELLSEGDESFVVEDWLDAMGITEDDFYSLEWHKALPAATTTLSRTVAQNCNIHRLKL